MLNMKKPVSEAGEVKIIHPGHAAWTSRQSHVQRGQACKLGVVGAAPAVLAGTPAAQRLLLGRLQLLGDGTREAANRRDWAVAIEAAAVRERRAQVVCLQEGRAICRSGFGLLQ